MAAEMPLVSIVTPSFNQGRYVRETIESIRSQDYPRVEHIVVDGGSTDETLAVLAEYDHLRWVSEPDRGQSHALNKGFAMARGEIFAWLNSDDYYLPGAVSRAVEVLQSSGSALVYGGVRALQQGRPTFDQPAAPFDLSVLLATGNRIGQPAAFFTRASFEAVDGIDESLRYAMDYDLWAKLGARFDVTHIDDVLAVVRFHEDCKSIREQALIWPEMVRVSRRHGGAVWSKLYLDHYAPVYRPRLFRLAVAGRLLRSGEWGTLQHGLLRRIGLRPRQGGG